MVMMNNLENDFHHIWHPDLYEIFQQAIAQKTKVSIQSHLPLDRCNSADVKLNGHIIAMTEQQGQYLVDGYDLWIGKSFPVAPSCEYSFAVDMPEGMNGKAKIEYSGRALILDRELQKNNLPESLLLRVCLPNRIRRLRRHVRRECAAGSLLMPGLMLIDHEPASRKKLLALMEYYYQQKNRPKPILVNISAGGVCLQTMDPHVQRFVGADQNFLFFFFFAADNGKPKYPGVFLGKKVGIFRSASSRHAGLRLCFLKELVWAAGEDELKWLDIEAEGSKVLREIIAQWPDA